MRIWFCARHLTWVVLSFTFNVFYVIPKNMNVVCQSNTHRHRASHREGYNPWKLNFLIQSTFFLLFCNNSSNEKENEITSRNRWSMTPIHQLGCMLSFCLGFIQTFTCTWRHTDTVLQMPHRCKQDTGCTAAKTLLRLSLMYFKSRALNESPPLTKSNCLEWLKEGLAVIKLNGVVRAIHGHSTWVRKAMPRLKRPSTLSSVH